MSTHQLNQDLPGQAEEDTQVDMQEDVQISTFFHPTPLN